MQDEIMKVQEETVLDFTLPILKKIGKNFLHPMTFDFQKKFKTKVKLSFLFKKKFQKIFSQI